MSNWFADAIDNVGTALNLPEWGISEGQGGGSTVNTGRVQGSGNAANSPLINNAFTTRQVSNGLNFDTGASGQLQNGAQSGAVNNNAAAVAAAAAAASKADAIASYNDQMNQLQALLGRTNTGLDQALTKNTDEYNRNVGAAEADKAKQLAAYSDKEVAQNQGKLDSYGTINRNANNGFRSLAQIIGRASGTGSSAFQELLPDVIGKDTSGKRQEVTETYGRNLQGIQKARDQYGLDFQGVLEDLARQRGDNENAARSGIEGQRQSINQQLASVAAQKAAANGGGYAAQRDAAQPYQSAIDNSRNQVESFFNQFRTAYTPRQAVAAAPELSDFTVDRSTINAQNQGAADPTNPYADLLRKRLQEQA